MHRISLVKDCNDIVLWSGYYEWSLFNTSNYRNPYLTHCKYSKISIKSLILLLYLSSFWSQYSATSDEATFPLEPVSPQQQHYNNKSPYNNNPNYYGNNNYNNTAPYNNGNHNNNNNGAYRDNRDGQYDVRYERQDGGQGRDGWVPYNENDKKGAANTMQYNNANANNNAFNAANVLSSSSKTYTMPDGTVVTEVGGCGWREIMSGWI